MVRESADFFVVVREGAFGNLAHRERGRRWSEHVGYGVGLELHGSDGGFLVEGSLASSIDGGIMLNATLNPVLDARPRWR